MSDSTKLRVWMTALICATVSSVAWAIAWCNASSWRSLSEHGYTQVRDVESPGGTRWVAPPRGEKASIDLALTNTIKFGEDKSDD